MLQSAASRLRRLRLRGDGVARLVRPAVRAVRCGPPRGRLAGVLLCVGFQRKHRRLEHRVGDDAVLGMRSLGRRATEVRRRQWPGASSRGASFFQWIYMHIYISLFLQLSKAV